MATRVRLRQAAQVLGIPEATLRDIRFKSAPRFAASGQLTEVLLNICYLRWLFLRRTHSIRRQHVC